jgi:hypothetical protein
MDTEWIVGRKEIMAALHLDSWASVRRWKKRYRIPIINLPNGKPAILRSELSSFFFKWAEKVKKWHTMSTP